MRSRSSTRNTAVNKMFEAAGAAIVAAATAVEAIAAVEAREPKRELQPELRVEQQPGQQATMPSLGLRSPANRTMWLLFGNYGPTKPWSRCKSKLELRTTPRRQLRRCFTATSRKMSR